MCACLCVRACVFVCMYAYLCMWLFKRHTPHSEGCDLDSPVGFNGFGWSIKSSDGCIYNRADSRPYSRDAIHSGDVIGCLLHLTQPLDAARPLPTGGR